MSQWKDTIPHKITLGQMLDQAVAINPDGDAMVYLDRDFRLTYRQFSEHVDKLAKGLMALGVEPGQKVAVWATNVPFWVTLMFATAKIGAVLITVNTHYRSAELDYLLKQSEAENLFLVDTYRDCDFLNTVYELVPELKTQERGHLTSERFPHLKRVCFLDQAKHRGMYSIPEIMDVSRMVSDEEYQKRQEIPQPDDVVNMQYTSGTTGFPKGVMLTHTGIGNNGFWIGENQNFTPKDRVCLPVPLFHCFGCVLGVMAVISHACTLVILEEFDAVQVMASVEQEKCTALYGVPTMFIAILQHKLFEKFNFSSLRTGIMAGSPCPVKTMQEVIEKMNMTEVTICYGLTENSPVLTQTVATDDIKHRTETVGRIMPGMEMKLLDPDTGEEVGPGKPGEILCRGYSVMKGYYNQQEATDAVLTKDGWLHTGDLGTIDHDGYLAITGRCKDMIIRGGENIYPREIEEFLHSIEGVKDVQVVGVPSKKYGEQVGAFVQLEEDVEITPQDIKDYCRGQISRYKIPKYVAIVDEYPLTASGKVQKYRLREISTEMWPNA